MMSFDNYLFALLGVLAPVFVYFSFLYKRDFFRDESIWFGLVNCLTILFTMSFPLELATGHIFDLRTIPWLLAFFYGGLNMGVLATAIIIIFRLFIGIDDGFFITLFTYIGSSITVWFFVNKYKVSNLKQKLMISFFLTVVNILLISSGMIYFLENFNLRELSPFFLYFTASHIVTVLIVVYIIESLHEKEQNKMRIQQTERIKIIGEMAAAVAHEIRSPLTVVNGFMQILKSEKNLTKNQLNSIELMESELQRAEKIINDYLSLAKMDTTDLEKIDIKEILCLVVQVLESYALLNGVTITNKVEQSYFVNANRNELKQVFINIIKNGIESITDKGDLTISAYKKGNYVEINITDTGKGMSAKEIKRLGFPFYTTKDQGTGLGTMVSYKIVDNLKGEINVKSKPKDGTTFFITLPIIKSRFYK